MAPLQSESSEHIVKALSEKIPIDAYSQLKWIRTDDPSPKLLDDLRSSFPNVVSLALDPIHTAINYEYASGRRRTSGSSLLRRILSKFNSHDSKMGPHRWGAVYTGEHPRPLSGEEGIIRDMILEQSMCIVKARELIDACEWKAPLKSRVEFIELLAALSALHPSEMQIPNKKGTVHP